MLTPFTMWLCTGTLIAALVVLGLGAAIRGRSRCRLAMTVLEAPEEMAPPPLPEEEKGVASDFYRPFDLLVCTILLTLYLSTLIGGWMGNVGGEPVEIDRTDLVAGIVTQAFFTFMVVGAVIWRRNPVLWLGLRWPGADLRQWLIALVGIPAAVVATWMVAVVMHASGFLDYLTSLDGGGDGKQEVVKAFETTQDPVNLFLLAFMASVVAPVTEEIIFRGYVYPVAKRYCGVVAAALGSSLLFALIHYNAVGLIPLAFLSILMTVAYEKTRSIWMPIAIHMAFNSATVLAQLGQRFGWWEVPQ